MGQSGMWTTNLLWLTSFSCMERDQVVVFKEGQCLGSSFEVCWDFCGSHRTSEFWIYVRVTYRPVWEHVTRVNTE